MFRSISARQAILWVIAVAMLSVMGANSLYTNGVITQSTDYTRKRFEDSDRLAAFKLDQVSLVLAAMDSVIDRDEGRISPERQTEIDTLAERMTAQAKSMADLADTPEEKAIAARIAGEVATLVTLVRVDLKRAIESRAEEAEFDRLDDVIDTAGTKVGASVELMRKSLAEELDEAWSEQGSTMTSTLSFSVTTYGIAVLVLSALSWFVSRSMIKPLTLLTGAMHTLAEGDTTTRVPTCKEIAEIDQMCGAVEVFKANKIEADRLEAEQAAAKARAEAERRQAMLALAESFENSVKDVVNQVAAAAGQMKSTAEGLAGASDTSGQHATHLASAAEQTAGNVSTVASAAEELAASIAEISRRVAQSSSISRSAVDEARKVDTIVRDLSEAVGRIGAVVSMITDVASQTNLLALNATIEAARAGDAGKGFAVVAGEVKSLANQTTKATDEITAQIGAVQQATQQAVAAIQGIVGVIDEMSEIAGTIAAAVEQQGAATAEIARNVQQAATGTTEVSGSVAEMSGVVEQVRSSAGEVLAAANDMSGNAGRLSHQVDTFLATVRAA
ncbi:MAG TPA: methyl-accepting chemotaxis protein [Candidatus Omnitrophota bacterium]|nr:methyl-accepting chemotaxis protein [Candidatus Omnitrophota bacterium]